MTDIKDYQTRLQRAELRAEQLERANRRLTGEATALIIANGELHAQICEFVASARSSALLSEQNE